MNRVFIRITLLITIAISIVLSFFIWTNSYWSNHSEVIQNRSVADINYSRNLAKLYLPIKVFYVDENQNKSVLPNGVDKINKSLSTLFKKVDLRQLGRSNTQESLLYSNIIKQSNSIQLFYQAPITIKTLANDINFKYNHNINNFSFNRIVVVRNSPIDVEIYFANDNTKEYLHERLSLNSSDLFDLANRDKKVSVEEEPGKAGYISYYKKALNLYSYSYLIRILDDNSYVSSFMTNDGSAGLTYDSKRNIYKKGLSKTLSINEKTGAVYFEDNDLSKDEIPNNLSDLLQQSKIVLQKIGNPFNSFRLFAHPKKNKVIFRSFIEGSPVFFNQGEGDVTLSWGNHSQTINFSNTSLEIPISKSDKTQVLQPTKDMVKSLNESGIDTKKIEDIQVGYYKSSDSENDEIMTFIPSYFVKINGVYHEVTSLLKNNK